MLSDFNLIDAFRIFDTRDKGQVPVKDIEYTLKILGVPKEQDDLLLLCKKFQREDSIRFVDFKELFLPKSDKHAEILKSRRSADLTAEYRLEVFDTITMDKFKRALKLHFEILRAAESLRQRIAKAGFTLDTVFSAVDSDKKGYIEVDEFQRLLSEHGIVTTENDLLTLMDRYDKNKDGKISYDEFESEIMPHSPIKN